MKSFVREVSGTGEHYNQLGDRPDGYYERKDGTALVVIVDRLHAQLLPIADQAEIAGLE